MTIRLTPELEAALNDVAKQRGVPPEAVALDALRQTFLPKYDLTPRDEWERGLLAAARDYGVSLPDSAFTSDELYD
jgi:predicted transcriptional regulator